ARPAAPDHGDAGAGEQPDQERSRDDLRGALRLDRQEDDQQDRKRDQGDQFAARQAAPLVDDGLQHGRLVLGLHRTDVYSRRDRGRNVGAGRGTGTGARPRRRGQSAARRSSAFTTRSATPSSPIAVAEPIAQAANIALVGVAKSNHSRPTGIAISSTNPSAISAHSPPTANRRT